jgi:hypothetical protein
MRPPLGSAGVWGARASLSGNHAVFPRTCAETKALEQLEADAREAKPACLRNPNPHPPWEWGGIVTEVGRVNRTAAGVSEGVEFLFYAGVRPDGLAGWMALHFSSQRCHQKLSELREREAAYSQAV